jgi:hypothetical protein
MTTQKINESIKNVIASIQTSTNKIQQDCNILRDLYNTILVHDKEGIELLELEDIIQRFSTATGELDEASDLLLDLIEPEESKHIIPISFYQLQDGTINFNENQHVSELIQALTIKGYQIQIEQKGLKSYAYTVGLWRFFHRADFLCFGLEPTKLQTLLTTLANRVRANDFFIEGRSYKGLLEDYPIQFRKVTPENIAEYAAKVDWFNDYQPFDLLQLFWPDVNGKYPWDEECNTTVKVLQPLLFK